MNNELKTELLEEQKMKTVRTDNAFPIPGLHADESFNGLTIRQYYAAKAMQAIIGTAAGPCIVGGLDGAENELAKSAFKIADAMINFEEQG